MWENSTPNKVFDSIARAQETKGTQNPLTPICVLYHLKCHESLFDIIEIMICEDMLVKKMEDLKL